MLFAIPFQHCHYIKKYSKRNRDTKIKTFNIWNLLIAGYFTVNQLNLLSIYVRFGGIPGYLYVLRIICIDEVAQSQF